MMNGLVVTQQGQFYTIYTPQGIMIAQIFMGGDGQTVYDATALKSITKVMAKRWGINPNQDIETIPKIV